MQDATSWTSSRDNYMLIYSTHHELLRIPGSQSQTSSTVSTCPLLSNKRDHQHKHKHCQRKQLRLYLSKSPVVVRGDAKTSDKPHITTLHQLSLSPSVSICISTARHAIHGIILHVGSKQCAATTSLFLSHLYALTTHTISRYFCFI